MIFKSLSAISISSDQRIYTALILDALKRMPQFHEKLMESRQLEINAWENIVCTARAQGRSIPLWMMNELQRCLYILRMEWA